MEYTIDLKNVKTLWELHNRLKEDLILPDYYGMNMDALWDCLTGGCIEIPSTIYIKSLNELPKELKEKGKILKDIFYEASDWYRNLGIKLSIIELN